MNTIRICLVIISVLSMLLIYSLVTVDDRRHNMVIGATAVCKDGYITTTPRGRGVCSSHGGVKKWLD